MTADPNYYWTHECPNCKQGSPVFMKDRKRGLYIHCGECEAGWWSPGGASFLTINDSADASFASMNDIEVRSWEGLVVGRAAIDSLPGYGASVRDKTRA